MVDRTLTASGRDSLDDSSDCAHISFTAHRYLEPLPGRNMVEATNKVHIDENVGVDESAADGSTSSPYKSLLFAHIQHPPSADTLYLTRKSETGPVRHVFSADINFPMPNDSDSRT